MRFVRKLFFSILAAVPIAASADMLAVDFNGGIFRVDGSGRYQRIPNAPVTLTNSLAVSDTGRIYTVTGNQIYQIDPDTGEFGAFPIALSSSQDLRGLTWMLGELWGIDDHSPSDRLIRINPSSGAVTVVGSTGNSAIQALAAVGSSLYAWSITSGLMTVNSGTGAATDVNVGLGGPNIQGMEVDNDGRLIASDRNLLYKVNLDGTTTLLPGALAEDIRGIVPIKRFEKMIGYGSADEYEFDSADKVKSRGVYGGTVTAAATAPDGSHYIAFNSGNIFKEEPNSNLRFLVGNTGFVVRAMTFRNGVLFAARDDAGVDRIYTLSPTTAAATFLGNSGMNEVVGMATQPGTNAIYVFDSVVGLGTMNPATGACADVSGANPGNAQIQSIEFYESGVLRGAGTGYWSIIHTTGALSLVNGFPTGMGGLCLLRKPGTMYGVELGGSYSSIDLRTGTGTLAGASVVDGNSMTMGGDGRLYIGTEGGQIGVVDVNSGAFTSLASFPGRQWRGLAWLGNDLYGINNTGGADDLYRINPLLGTATLVGSTGFTGVQSLTTSPDGTMYAYDIASGLLTVDALTGAATDVNLGVGAVSIQALEFGLLDRLYAARDDLYTLNTPTGLSTLIGGAGYTDLRGLGYVR